MKWIFISLGGFAVFLALAALLIFYGGKLKLTIPIYFFLLVIMALIATGFLTGALRSNANYKGDVAKGKLMLSGPALVFVIIIYLGYKFRPLPDETALSLTVNVFGPAGRTETISKGQVKVQFDNDIRVEEINSKGQAVFAQVNSTFRGKQIHIIPVVKDYFLSGGDTVITIPDEPLAVVDMQLQKQPASTSIRGLLVDGQGRALKNASVNFLQFGKNIKADEQGIFETVLPLKEGEETDIIIYVNNDVKYRNKLTVASTVTIPVK